MGFKAASEQPNLFSPSPARLLGLLTSPSRLPGSAVLFPGLSGCRFYRSSGTA